MELGPCRGLSEEIVILESSCRILGGKELVDDALVLDQCQCSILSSLDPGGHTHIPGLQPAEGSRRLGVCVLLAGQSQHGVVMNRGGGGGGGSW